MQKALVQMNLQLALVVSDITGMTGLRILRNIVAGRRDPSQITEHRDHRCYASKMEITAELTGNDRPEHVFVLHQTLNCSMRVKLSSRPVTPRSRRTCRP